MANKAIETPWAKAGYTKIKAIVRQLGGDEVTRLPRVSPNAERNIDDQFCVFELAEGEEILGFNPPREGWENDINEVPFVGGKEIS